MGPRNYANGPLSNLQRVIDSLFPDAEEEAAGLGGSVPMPVEEVKALKRSVHMVYGLLEQSSQETNCPICLETIAPGEQVVEPGCAASQLHSGHAHCFEDWLARSGTCPVCREMLADDEEEEGEVGAEEEEEVEG